MHDSKTIPGAHQHSGRGSTRSTGSSSDRSSENTMGRRVFRNSQSRGILVRGRGENGVTRAEDTRPRLYRGPKSNLSARDQDAAYHHCGIKQKCGSCLYVNQDYADGLQKKHLAGLKVLEEAGVLAGAKLLPPEEAPKIFEYRSVFKLATRRPSTSGPGRPGQKFSIGLFEPGSHRVVEMGSCPLHTPPLRKLIEDLQVELDLSELTPYDEGSGSGDLRYIVARSAHLTGEVLLTFVVTRPLKTVLRQLVVKLQTDYQHRITSAYMNINSGSGNEIMADQTERIFGATGLRERLLDLDFEIGPRSFFQVNPWQAQNLYRRVDQLVGLAPKGSVAWDLYSGVGQISLLLGSLGYRVLGVEEIEEAVGDALQNAARNRLEDKVSFLASKVEDLDQNLAEWARSPQVVVVNPSRRGLAPQARSSLVSLLRTRPQTRLIYVSCEVETLARDLKELTEEGVLRVRQIEAFDMFPHTTKMEWIAVLTH